MKDLFYVLLLILIPNLIQAQEILENQIKEEPNSAIRTGRLANGFNYFIKPMPNDMGKIKMNLIVKAGANEEDKDQENLAHLLEHMAVNYTENFPALRQDPDFFAQLDMKPRDLMAKTGGNSTQYKFQYPQQMPTALDTALKLYHDIASSKVLFKEDAIQGERKALFQEIMQGGGPGAGYTDNKIYYLLTGCNNVTEPQNLKTSLMSSSTTALKRFYQDWYRPDLMSLTVVGNVKDVDQVERKIRNTFSNLKVPAQKRNLKRCGLNYSKSPGHFIVIKDPQTKGKSRISETEWQFYFRNDNLYFKNYSTVENRMVWDLLTDMVYTRLKQDLLNYNKDYKTVFYTDSDLPAERLYLWVTDNNEDVLKGAFRTLAGIAKYGFEKGELESAVHKKIEILKNKDYSSSGLWSDMLLNFVLGEEKLPGTDNYQTIDFFKNMNLKKINELVKKISWKPDDIALILPHKATKWNFTKSGIRDWINDGLDHPKPYKPFKAPQQLIPNNELAKLTRTKIANKDFGNLNEDIIELNNGLRVILKYQKPDKGRFRNKIVVHGFSPFGASCFGSSNGNVMLAPLVVRNAGLGSFNKFQIGAFLHDSSLPFGIRDYITERETGLYAEVAPEDLETLLQLIYLSFTAPRYDPEAFKDWKMEEFLRLQKNTTVDNEDFVDFTNAETGKVSIPLGTKRYRQSLKMDYEDSFEKYKKLHSEARNFTFIFTGNFKKNAVLPLIQKYLGNLPNRIGPKKCLKTDKVPKKFVNKAHDARFTFDHHLENAFLSIQFKTPLTNRGYMEEVRLEFLKRALNLKLKKLRYEKKLGVYIFTAIGSIDRDHITKTMQVYLQASPADFQEVLQTCNDIFDDLRNGLVSKEFLKTVKESAFLPKWIGEFSQTNKYVSRRLYAHYRYDKTFTESEAVLNFMKNFSKEDLRKTAIAYLKDNYKWVLTGLSKQ